jgi:hypothetical protein
MRLKVLDFLLSLKEPDVCLVAFLLFEQIEAETQLLPRWCSERLYYLNYFDYLFNSSLLPSQESDPSTPLEPETGELGGTHTWNGRGGGAKKKEWNYQSDYRELLKLYPSQNRIPEHRFQLPKDWQKRGKKSFLKTEFV